MSASWNHRRWMAVIACPHCREEHRVLWPHPSYPSGSTRYSIEWPRAALLVVFPAAIPWGELTSAEQDRETLTISPFPE